jgi:hypothetical protein
MQKFYPSTGDESNSTGTGQLALLGIVPPQACVTTILATFAEGDNFLGYLYNADGSQSETSDCTVSIQRAILTRTYCRTSSNNNQFVNFTGPTTYIRVLPASDIYTYVNGAPPNPAIGALWISPQNIPYIFVGYGWFDLTQQSRLDDQDQKISLLMQALADNDLILPDELTDLL